MTRTEELEIALQIAMRQLEIWNQRAKASDYFSQGEIARELRLMDEWRALINSTDQQ